MVDSASTQPAALVVAGVPARALEVEAIATRLGLPIEHGSGRLCLYCDEQGWSLRSGNSVVRVNYESGAATYRRLHGGGRGEMLARAIGLKSGNRIPSVLDATAGLGRDAFVLASLGCEVEMMERSPVVHLLLQDGLHRAMQSTDGNLVPVIARLSLKEGDSRTALSIDEGQAVPDVIYLDPMFPERNKTAAVKKEMALFQAFLPEDHDADQLLLTALEANPCRVVVKRPRHAPPLAGRAPSMALSGKSTRFDVYALRSLAVR